MLSLHLVLPQKGHLEQVYLKQNHNAELVLDQIAEIDSNQFLQMDWEATEFGDELEEILPDSYPQPLGLGIIMRVYFDTDHASDSVTRRSRTGFIVYFNNVPIYWASKKQNSVETSSFGSEFMAMKHCNEYLRGL